MDHSSYGMSSGSRIPATAWSRKAEPSIRIVATPPPQTSNTPYRGTPVSLPGIVQAENFDEGGQGVAYYDTSPGNKGGVYRNSDVDIGPTGDAGNADYFLGWARVGEWVKYTVYATQTRQYTLQVRIANVGSGASFRIEVDGADVRDSIGVPDTGGWDTWKTISLAGIPLNQGQHVIRIVMVTSNRENSSVGNFGFFSLQ